MRSQLCNGNLWQLGMSAHLGFHRQLGAPFALLNVDEVHVASTEEDTNVATETTLIGSARVGESVRGKQRSISATGLDTMAEDEVVFSVSHEALKSGVRPLRRPGAELVGGGHDAGKKKSNILQDISNSFLLRPILSKPNQLGPIPIRGSTKDLGATIGTDEATISKTVDESELGRRSSPNLGSHVAGSSPSRPPVPTSFNLGHPSVETIPIPVHHKRDGGGVESERMATDDGVPPAGGGESQKEAASTSFQSAPPVFFIFYLYVCCKEGYMLECSRGEQHQFLA